ncbi:MAG: BolA family transcriptional regulator [Gammaproteobacteria bacterium]|nr:BolA family transcriptional regulator [Gammaproteobacteria bacterium]
MNPDAIKALILNVLPDAELRVAGDDGVHFEAVIVSASFAGVRPVKRHQMVYAALNDKLASGELHALSFKTYTPDEWQASQA